MIVLGSSEVSRSFDVVSFALEKDYFGFLNFVKSLVVFGERSVFLEIERYGKIYFRFRRSSREGERKRREVMGRCDCFFFYLFVESFGSYVEFSFRMRDV